MLNYIKAELWKAARRRGMLAFYAVLFLLAVTFCTQISAGTFEALASGVCIVLVLGMLMGPILAHQVDGGVPDTLKNELSFGLSRSRIYLGKLAAVLLTGLLVAGAILLVCVGGGWLLTDHSSEDTLVSLEVLLFALLGAVPLWCGMAAVCHMAALLIPGTAVWTASYYILFFFGQPILVLVAFAFFHGNTNSMPMNLIEAILMPYTLLMPTYLSGWLTWEYQLWCWGIGLGWLVFSTVLGLLLLGRKDIH